MSNPADLVGGTPDLVNLVVQAQDATTEVFLIDGRFNLVDSGLGRIETKVAPGMYKVKFKAGDSFKEVRRAVRAGQQVQVTEERPVHFNSAAPLYETAMTHEYHLAQAARVNSHIHTRLGDGGSKLFVFVRDFFSTSESPRPDESLTDEPASGLTLHDMSGKLLVDFSTAAEKANDPNEIDKWAGCTVELDPGYYRLRVDAAEMGIFEQSVVTCRGWQTQVFLLRRNYGHERAIQRADLSGASILMARMDQTFDPYQRGLRLSEMARKGLENGRLVVSDTILRASVQDESLWQDQLMRGASPDPIVEEMLYGKYENPMLGIYGAHLLLSTQNTSQQRELLRIVAGNLHKLVGDDHPDVRALDLYLSEDGQDVAAFTAPPMLRSSWKTIVRASVRRPELVPAGSLAASIAPHTWGDGAWLVWRTAPDSPVSPPVRASSTARSTSGASFASERFQSAESSLTATFSTGADALFSFEIDGANAASSDAELPVSGQAFPLLGQALQQPSNLQYIEQQLRDAGSLSRAVTIIARQIQLTSLEANLLNYVYQAALQISSTQAFGNVAVPEGSIDDVPATQLSATLADGLQQLTQGAQSDSESWNLELVRVLGVPQAVVDEAIQGLVQKLGQAASPSV